MMFLQYAIWGAWLPFLWSFLADHRGMNGDQIGWMFAVGAVGAIIGPFVAGQIADRLLRDAEVPGAQPPGGRGAGLEAGHDRELPGLPVLLARAYGLVYSPTLSLTNSLAFHHLPDRDRDFGRVRLWGTFGWIAVGLMMGQWLALAAHADGSRRGGAAGGAGGPARPTPSA